ncbi:MAG: MarR family transcriptional regulator [Burkholderiaceae bacterium]|nr:MarR family transcriptional regulator [Burkholderiaceae bacterium]
MATKKVIKLDDMPGHLFRRLHQLAVTRFTAVMVDAGLTPIQWAALVTTSQRPGLDQSTLSREIYIDTSTIAGVLDRLEARGLIQRRLSAEDRRLRLLYLTDEGTALLKQASVAVVGMQKWLVEPLTVDERAMFTQLMLKVLHRLEK